MRFAANKDFQSVDTFVNTLFCSSCGVCEMYACPQGLQPRSMIAEYKAGLRKAGVKPPTVDAREVFDSREYRKVPENRLEMRLGIHKYNKPAPLDNGLRNSSQVRIELSQHIGAPAIAAVEKGQQVKRCDVVAKAADGLSVNIHASIDGVVTEVTDKFIIIKR
jgi:Na+-translocating ferredoxin:NAD+ oxidoreductase RnfC subunit